MLNRREAIAAGVGLLAGVVKPSPPAEAKLGSAQFTAEWEIMALRSNCPRTWRQWQYVTGCQWDKTRFAILGVGPPEHCEREFAFQCQQWGEHLLDSHIEPDGRAWALMLQGVLSPRLREELRHGAPSFDDVFNRWFVEAGEDPERIAAVDRRLARL